jgi:hypothetical protein
LRKNANWILAPLKVIKIRRPKSAIYRKKFDQLQAAEHDEEDYVRKIPWIKHVTSNFLELRSPRKLIKKAINDPSEWENANESSKEDVMDMFELKVRIICDF